MTTATGTNQNQAAMDLADQISEWLRRGLEESAAERFVVAVSGGIDSALVCGLAARAVGSDRVLGIVMPSASNPDDAVSAARVAEAFDFATITVDLTEPTKVLENTLPRPHDVANLLNLDSPVHADAQKLADANVKPRLRMTTSYYVANLCNGIVLGTGNKSEAMIGYFTKYGDGGVDLMPIVDLYKHEVRELARAIGVPESVVNRPPSAGLWEGQTDEDEIGLTYDQLDSALMALESGDSSDVPSEVLDRVRSMVSGSQHKRAPVPAFRRR